MLRTLHSNKLVNNAYFLPIDSKKEPEKEMKEVDIIIESPILYKEARKNALHLKIDDIVVTLMSIDDLINMKRNTGRNIDQVDIDQLKKLKKIKRL